MKHIFMKLALCLAASAASSSVALAAPICAGTNDTYKACVETTKLITGQIQVTCVYLGEENCTPVNLPYPKPGVITLENCEGGDNPDCD